MLALNLIRGFAVSSSMSTYQYQVIESLNPRVAVTDLQENIRGIMDKHD